MATIRKRGKKWCIGYRIDGKQIVKVIDKSKEITAEHLKEYTDQDYPSGIGEDYYEFKVNDPNAFFLRAQGDSYVS